MFLKDTSDSRHSKVLLMKRNGLTLHVIIMKTHETGGRMAVQ